MRFSKALPILFSEFRNREINHALVGGLALYTLGTGRSTFDADFMILLSQADDMDELMKKLGYEQLQKNNDVANYVSKDPEMGQVDFLFAHRKYALSMLKRAEPRTLLGHRIAVLRPEDLIGLKVQSSSNDPDRMNKDMADIEEMLKKYRHSLDWEMVEKYFSLFERESEFESLKRKFK